MQIGVEVEAGPFQDVRRLPVLRAASMLIATIFVDSILVASVLVEFLLVFTYARCTIDSVRIRMSHLSSKTSHPTFSIEVHPSGQVIVLII